VVSPLHLSTCLGDAAEALLGIGLALGKQARLEAGLRPGSVAIGCLPEQESMGLTASAEGKRLSADVKKHFEAHTCTSFSLRCEVQSHFSFSQSCQSTPFCFLSSGNSKKAHREGTPSDY